MASCWVMWWSSLALAQVVVCPPSGPPDEEPCDALGLEQALQQDAPVLELRGGVYPGHFHVEGTRELRGRPGEHVVLTGPGGYGPGLLPVLQVHPGASL